MSSFVKTVLAVLAALVIWTVLSLVSTSIFLWWEDLPSIRQIWKWKKEPLYTEDEPKGRTA